MSSWDDAVPSETSTLRFRHRLEQDKLAGEILAEVNDLLTARGLLQKTGAVVDATLISAPSSTKNKDGARNPQMHKCVFHAIAGTVPR